MRNERRDCEGAIVVNVWARRRGLSDLFNHRIWCSIRRCVQYATEVRGFGDKAGGVVSRLKEFHDE